MERLLVAIILFSGIAKGQETSLSSTPCGARLIDAYNMIQSAENSADGKIQTCAPAADASKNTTALLGRLDQHEKTMAAAWERYVALKPRLAQIGDPDSQTESICSASAEVKGQVKELQTQMRAVLTTLDAESAALAAVSRDFQGQYKAFRWGNLFRTRAEICRKTSANVSALGKKLNEMASICEKQVQDGPEASYAAIYGLGYAIAHGCTDGGCASVNTGESNYEVDNVDAYGRWEKIAGGEMSHSEAEAYIDKNCDKSYQDE